MDTKPHSSFARSLATAAFPCGSVPYSYHTLSLRFLPWRPLPLGLPYEFPTTYVPEPVHGPFRNRDRRVAVMPSLVLPFQTQERPEHTGELGDEYEPSGMELLSDPQGFAEEEYHCVDVSHSVRLKRTDSTPRAFRVNKKMGFLRPIRLTFSFYAEARSTKVVAADMRIARIMVRS